MRLLLALNATRVRPPTPLLTAPKPVLQPISTCQHLEPFTGARGFKLGDNYLIPEPSSAPAILVRIVVIGKEPSGRGPRSNGHVVSFADVSCLLWMKREETPGIRGKFKVHAS